MGLTESSFLERMEEMGFTVRKSNADRIRAMTDEELARFFCDEYGCPIGRGYPDCGETPTDPVCVGCWLEWLRQEASD